MKMRALVVGLFLLTGCHKPSANSSSDGEAYVQQADTLLRLFLRSQRSPEDAARIVDLLQKACDLGSGHGCELLAGQIYAGNLPPPDPPRVIHLYERACALQEVRSCDQLSYFYREGKEVPKDARLARKYRQLACGLADSMTRETFCEWDKHSTLDAAAAPN